jgi:hypothetical protein
MKIKQYLISLLVASTSLTFTQVVNAQECPPLKSDTTKVLVTDNRAELRSKEDIKKNRSTTDRPQILQGNNLETIDIKDISSIIKNGTECWYKVQYPGRTGEYWIEKSNIENNVLDFGNVNNQQEPPEPPPINTSSTAKDTSQSDRAVSRNRLNVFVGLILILSFLNLFFLIFVIGLPERKKRATLKQSIKKLDDELEENKKELKNINQHLLNMKANSSYAEQQLVKEINTIVNEVRSLAVILREQQFQANQPKYEPDIDIIAIPIRDHSMSNISISGENLLGSDRTKIDDKLPNQLSTLINGFNQGNTDYFSNERFMFFKPTSATNLGSQGVGMDAKSKIEFQQITDNVNQASYIGFRLSDNNTYLIPNLFTTKWKQVISNDENKIFELHGSNYILVEPAIIEAIGNDIWRLVKPGKFD